MWKATTTSKVNKVANDSYDDWDTDPDFVNTVSEKEQRWGSKTVEGSGRSGFVDIDKLREDVKNDDKLSKKKEYESSSIKPSLGYGGKFGVQNDRVDKSAVGFDYQNQLEKHSSQKDYAHGFGGKFGVMSDRKDKSAVGFDHVENVEKHGSQVDHSKGFGGKFGVMSDRKDKSAVGFDHVENVEKHGSQVDHSKGFGGKFGVEKTMDKSAVGFDHVQKLEKHSSQVDHSKGFGGKFGVEKTMDKNACKFEDGTNEVVGTNYQRTRASSKTDLKDIKSKFENSSSFDDDNKNRSMEIRNERLNREKEEKDKENNKTSTINENKINAISNNSNENNRPKVGKLTINSQFLKNNNDTSTAQPQPVRHIPKKLNKDNLFKNVTSPLIDNSSNSNNHVIESKILPEQPSIVSYKKEEEKEVHVANNNVETNNGYSTNGNGYSTNGNGYNTNGNSYHTSPIQLIENNNNNHHQENEEEEDEWAQSSSPPKIEPVKVASDNFYPDTYENPDNLEEYVNVSHSQTQSTEQNNKVLTEGIQALAIYDYQASELDELAFNCDDIISNIQMIDEGWWQGTCNGNFGLFPANYVKLMN